MLSSHAFVTLTNLPYTKELILPLLGLVVALVGLSTDPKDRRKTVVTAVFLVLIAILTVAVASRDTVDHEKQVGWLQDQLDKIHTHLAEGFQRIEDRLANYGVKNAASVTLEDVSKIETANRNLEALPPAPEQVKADRHNTAVRYYEKDVDPKGLVGSLQGQGFSVETGQSKYSQPTNNLWVGDGVPIEDLKAAALTLLRANVRLKSLQRFHTPTSGNDRLIEVGHSINTGGGPDLAPAAILDIPSVGSLPRDPT